MIFSSILFLFRFLPICMGVYYVTPRKYKNIMLFIASLIFYCWGEVRYFPVMAVTIAVNYACALGIKRWRDNNSVRRLWLGLSIVFSLGVLCYFKYTDFFIGNINLLFDVNIRYLQLTLPLGVSFYTFQNISYTIDVYRGTVKAERSFINFGAYVALFPQLIAGPIVRYSDISRELESREHNPLRIQQGIRLFIMGLGSKVLVANNVGALWTEVESMDYALISTPLAWLALTAFALQIYFDFSGYSLMAIGIGRMLGFEFPRNFDYPYVSRSVTEFWRRWHMTLGAWFREYVYIPMGGNRKGTTRQYVNLFVVWAATGFWHGASWNFVLWGLFFFVFLCIEKTFLLEKLQKSRVISRVYLLLLVLVSWVLFAITDMGQAVVFLSRMFGFYAGGDWIYYLRNYAVTLGVGILLSMPVLRCARDKLGENSVAVQVFCAVVFAVSVAYLVDSTYNPFLYFRF